MTSLRIVLLLAGMAAAGCANSGQTYASQHPELTPAQRQILTTGKIPSGDAVAGLTRDEIKLAMGGPPAVFDKVDGQEAWSYLQKHTAMLEAGPEQSGSTGNRNRPTDLKKEFADPDANMTVRTTIIFAGNRATRAEVTQEKP